jgi:hypothetical protein
MIEDIDFLRKNSTKESFVLFVDSKNRNRYISPTPAEYVVEFTEPFHNVIGLDILDASIPRTMYIIDKYTDTFKFTIRYNNIDYNTKIVMDHQDYNIETLIAELTTDLMFDVGTTAIGIIPLSLSTPYIRKSVIYYTSKYPFKLDFTDAPIRELLGFDEYTDKTQTSFYQSVDNYIFGSVISNDTGSTSTIYTTVDIGNSFENNVYNTDLGSNYKSIYKNNSAVQLFNQPFDTNDFNNYSRSINNIIIYIGLNYINTTDIIPITLALLNIKWEIRNYNILDTNFGNIIANGNISTDTENITIEQLENLNNNTNPIFKVTLAFDSNSLNTFEYKGTDGLSSTLCFILHEDTKENEYGGLIWYNNIKYNNNQPSEKAYTFVWDNRYELSINSTYIDPRLILTNMNSTQFFGITINSSYKNYSLTPTGHISLVGERFIVLRCPEIEGQISGSYAFGVNSPGLALFKLGVLGYADARFDFASINSKEFHPIGKLTKLHFRYETSLGDLYDFKGVNHNLLIAVKYLQPSIKALPVEKAIINYPLNQNYNPDFINYKKTQDDILNAYSTDEEEVDYLKKNFNKIYLEKEKMYINSSDEDSSHKDDDNFDDSDDNSEENI